MVAYNLMKQVYNDDHDQKLLKIITCNKKYAAEIKEAVGKLNASIDASLQHLVMHARDLELKEDDAQMTKLDLKGVWDTFGTGLRQLSRTMVVHTPTKSTSSASTPRFLRDLSQTTPQSTPGASVEGN